MIPEIELAAEPPVLNSPNVLVPADVKFPDQFIALVPVPEKTK
jgi:hypothetical protein